MACNAYILEMLHFFEERRINKGNGNEASYSAMNLNLINSSFSPINCSKKFGCQLVECSKVVFRTVSYTVLTELVSVCTSHVQMAEEIISALLVSLSAVPGGYPAELQ